MGKTTPEVSADISSALKRLTDSGATAGLDVQGAGDHGAGLTLGGGPQRTISRVGR